MSHTTDNTDQSAVTSDSVETEASGVGGEQQAADLNGDGKISAAEAFVARVGEVDAALEARSKQGGIVGAAAGLLHKVLDRVDGDDAVVADSTCAAAVASQDDDSQQT